MGVWHNSDLHVCILGALQILAIEAEQRSKTRLFAEQCHLPADTRYKHEAITASVRQVDIYGCSEHTSDDSLGGCAGFDRPGDSQRGMRAAQLRFQVQRRADAAPGAGDGRAQVQAPRVGPPSKADRLDAELPPAGSRATQYNAGAPCNA